MLSCRRVVSISDFWKCRFIPASATGLQAPPPDYTDSYSIAEYFIRRRFSTIFCICPPMFSISLAYVSNQSESNTIVSDLTPPMENKEYWSLYPSTKRVVVIPSGKAQFLIEVGN